MLSYEQIMPYIHGAVQIKKADNFYSFSRFTDKQQRVIAARGLGPRENYTSGMRLEFRTNGGKLSFEYRAVKGISVDFLSVEITINAVPCYHKYETDFAPTGKIELEIEHSAEQVEVIVYFPNLQQFEIKNVDLPEDSVPVIKSKMLLILGDSITYGSVATHPHLTYANLVADALGAELLCQGVGGDTFCEDNLDEALAFHPDIITVAYGTNDWVSGTLTLDHVTKYLKKLTTLNPDSEIYVLLPIWRSNEDEICNNMTLADGRNLIRRAAEQFPHINVIDCSNFVPKVSEYFWDDCLHPNDLGFLYYAKALLNKIKK